VKFSPAFKWTIALLLPVTLTWKLYAGADNPKEFIERTSTFLARSGYETSIADIIPAVGMEAVRATKGDCHMFVVDRLGIGWTRQLMGLLTEDTSRYFTVFRGRVFDGDPTWLTAAAVTYFRGLRRLGFGRSALVVGITASPTCEADLLRWAEL
jgi:hypothetical protein